jgi:hypothetical protein
MYKYNTALTSVVPTSVKSTFLLQNHSVSGCCLKDKSGVRGRKKLEMNTFCLL